MKFQTVAEARRHLWHRLATECDHLLDLGVLNEEECDDEFDRRRMKKAVEHVRKSLAKKAAKS